MCSGCNLQLVYKRYLPVYLHNLKGYDAHLFIKCLNKYGQKGEEIKCIPNNEEKYISFNKKIKVDEYFNKKTKQMEAIYYEIRFLDTIAFMNTSIEKLVKNLSDSCESVQQLRETFK